MSRYTGPSCRQCRREGTKLFLKGTKCFTVRDRETQDHRAIVSALHAVFTDFRRGPGRVPRVDQHLDLDDFFVAIPPRREPENASRVEAGRRFEGMR